ncbi:lupus La protein-like [Argonauta hians]
MPESNGETLTGLEQKIIRQIEYYFGDINLSRDRFLQDQIKLDDGWVTMEIMLKFNRLKTLSEDAQVICDAIKKSKSGLMEVNEDSTKIRRSSEKPLPENTRERREEMSNRTLYVKGFPVNLTLDDLMQFFEKYGELESLVMKKNGDKTFKGSAYVVFMQKDKLENFLKTEDLKYGENELLKYRKNEYYKMKNEKRRQHKEEVMKEKQEQQLKKMEEKEKVVIVPGSVLHLSGFTKELDIDIIRTFFSDFAGVAWVDYIKGDSEAWVRFHDENQAVEVLEKARDADSKKIVLKENDLTGDVLEGDAEKEHWRKISEAKSAGMKNKRFGKAGGRKKFGKRNPKRGNDDDEPAAKTIKTEDGEPVKKAIKMEVGEPINNKDIKVEIKPEKAIKTEDSEPPAKVRKTEDN